MALFFVKDIRAGSVFGYVIKNYIVEVKDEEHLKALRKEPDRFQEVVDKKEAAKMAASLSTSEADIEPAEETEELKDEDKEKDEEEEATKKIAASKKQKKIKKR